MKKRSFYMIALVVILVLSMSIMLIACDNSKKGKDDEEEEEEKVVDIWKGVDKTNPEAIDHFVNVITKAKSFTYKIDNSLASMNIKCSKDVIEVTVSLSGSEKVITQYQLENGVVRAYEKKGNDWVESTNDVPSNIESVIDEYKDTIMTYLDYETATYDSETKSFAIVNVAGTRVDAKLLSTGIEFKVDNQTITVSNINNTKVSKIKSSSGQGSDDKVPGGSIANNHIYKELVRLSKEYNGNCYMDMDITTNTDTGQGVVTGRSHAQFTCYDESKLHGIMTDDSSGMEIEQYVYTMNNKYYLVQLVGSQGVKMEAASAEGLSSMVGIPSIDTVNTDFTYDKNRDVLCYTYSINENGIQTEGRGEYTIVGDKIHLHIDVAVTMNMEGYTYRTSSTQEIVMYGFGKVNNFEIPQSVIDLPVTQTM